jgi:uncharacterized protein
MKSPPIDTTAASPSVMGGATVASRAKAAKGVTDESGLKSCLYVGTVRHRRFESVEHSFTVRLYYAYLDLDELQQTFAGRLWWSAKRIAPMWFRRGDYFGPKDRPLADCVRDAVEVEMGVRPTGPVRVLTNLRAFGYVFNPVSLYYCFDEKEQLVAVLAQITNTPWGERHHYVIGPPQENARSVKKAFRKEFHVSPFQPMERDYKWAFGAPSETLAVQMDSYADGEKTFDATLLVARKEWSTRNLLGAMLRHPWMTAKVTTMIHWHAFLLWCKRATFFIHPKKRPVS